MGTGTPLEIKAQKSLIQISHNDHLSAATIQVYFYNSKFLLRRAKGHKIPLKEFIEMSKNENFSILQTNA